MIRGTTPTHIFTTDTDLSAATVLYITYSQNEETVVEKSINDVTIEPEQISVQLTQAETLLFDPKPSVEIQIRAGFADGSRIASGIIQTTADRILKEGAI